MTPTHTQIGERTTVVTLKGEWVTDIDGEATWEPAAVQVMCDEPEIIYLRGLRDGHDLALHIGDLLAAAGAVLR